jgi:hypothetical protein
LDLQAGETFTVETLNIFGYGDTFLEILDPGLATVTVNDDRSATELSSVISFTPATTGIHTVRVTRSFADNRSMRTIYGSYDLRAVPGVSNQNSLVPVGSAAGLNSQRFGVGVAFADYDLDGFVDLYLVNNAGAGPAGGQDEFFRNNRDLTFVDVTGIANLGTPEGGLAVAWGDYDNDGDPDLFVSDHGFFRNNGNGTFNDLTSSSDLVDIGREFDAAWVDADLDGYLDLFVVRRDGPSALWHNDGDGTFTDVAAGAGFDFPVDGGEAYSCSWGDYDGDGLPDLFMALRGDPGHALYRNLGNNQFVDVTDAAGLGAVDPATSGVWGDLTGDGRLDLFVASLAHNRLYVNLGNGTFAERGAEYGVHEFGASQGAGMADYDLDGDLDLYVVNLNAPNALHENLGSTMLRTGLALHDGLGFGCAWADVDNDGDPEIYLSRGCGQGCQANRLYQNFASEESGRDWLKVSLDGVDSNRDGLGAVIRVHGSGPVQSRELGTGTGWASKSRVPEVFGFPQGTTVDSVVVLWPSGVRDVVRSPTLRTLLVVTENSTTPVLPETTFPISVRLGAPFPNPFLGATTLTLSLSHDATVRVDVVSAGGRRVRSLAGRHLEAGTHILGWEGDDDLGRKAPPGVYFYRVRAGGRVQVKKLVLLGGH